MAPFDADTSTTVSDDTASTFEFNPSAPEFVPLVANLDETASKLVCGDLPAALYTQERPSRRVRKAEEARLRAVANAVPKEDAEKSKRSSIRRATTNTAESPGKVATLVVKNLALDLGKASVAQYLEEQGIPPVDVELHLDAIGSFRGTAFVRYASPGKAREALEKLGSGPEFGGRKARVELQKSKALIGRRCLEAELPQEELSVVRAEIERFLDASGRFEVCLPSNFSVQQRKYAHSLAEHHCLMHTTRQGEDGEKYVHLSKARRYYDEAHGRSRAHTVAGPCMPAADLLHEAAVAAHAAAHAWAAALAAEGSPTASGCSDSPVLGPRKKAHSFHVMTATPALGPLPMPSDMLAPPGMEDLCGGLWLSPLAAALSMQPGSPPPGLTLTGGFPPLDPPGLSLCIDDGSELLGRGLPLEPMPPPYTEE